MQDLVKIVVALRLVIGTLIIALVFGSFALGKIVANSDFSCIERESIIRCQLLYNK